MIKHDCCIGIFSLFILLSVGCGAGRNGSSMEFALGKVYPKVNCASDTNLSYSLCLPPQFEKGKPLPVLILFDSHGDGLLPVNLFKAEAAEHGFIIAGSNNSKNGMPTTETTAIYHAILADLSSKFTIVEKAVYLAGFSGGARVAAAIAITEGGIAGVIGCGAGMPGISQKPASNFSFLGVAGNLDFNFAELRNLDNSLENAGFVHHFILFEGIHQWPPAKVIPDIFAWIAFDAMRRGGLPVDRNETDRFIEENDKLATSMAASGKRHEQREIYLKMQHYLNGLTDVGPLEAEIKRLDADKEVITYRKKQEGLLGFEQKLQAKYAPEIQQKSLGWWETESAILQENSKKPANPDLNAVYKRVLGYLSLNCYMLSNGMLKQGDLAAASKYIEIYKMVDPTNSEHRYLAAKVAARKHNTDQVFQFLEQAFGLGFKDIARLQSDPDFLDYQPDARFLVLLKRK